LDRLTLEEKVAQLVFVWTPGKYFPDNSESWRELERLIVERKLGGFIFSIGDVYSFAIEINKLQRMSDIPLLIGADFEYGTGMRVRSATTFPRAMAVGATRNPNYAYEIGKITAVEGRALGVEQNYAPTVDVNNNPRNPVINTRSFGDDVQLVSEMGAAFVRGTQDGGMIATIKHFPGHGDTDVDTHLGLMTLNYDKEHFEKVEFPPFEAAIKAGAKSVMVGHIALPAYDTAAGIPATVSPHIIRELLKNHLKFHGLVVTDAMTMRGVADKYAPGEASVLAVEAGADLILMPLDADVAIDAIVAAVRRGEINEQRIDASARKLLAMKQWVGLDMNRFVDVNKISEVVNVREHQMLAEEIARNAVTVLGNEKNVLPLPKVDARKMLDLVISESDDPGEGRNFHRLLRERHPTLDFVKVDSRSDSGEYEAALQSARSSDVILCQLLYYTRSGERTGFIPKNQADFLRKVIALGKPVIAIAFGNPYVAMEFPRTDAYVCAYSDASVLQQAVAEVLFAEEPARGKLPITIPGVFKFGDGVEYPKQTLRTGLPEEAGFDSDELGKVDGIIQAAIKDSAFPGAVLLVAKDGIIVHEKAYGSHDYGIYSKRVDVNTIYDLASVTKVIATSSAVMRLVDEGKVQLTDPVVNYIPQFGQNGKENITIYNLMVHNSGLPAWRRFYDFCTTPQCVLDSVYATPLICTTGDSTVYSDLGLITLGKVIEQVSHTTLDRFVDSVFFKPLGMTSSMYNPPQRLWGWIAPTEVDTFWRETGQAVLGTVHDENASVLGGVSGHAGLFSRASDLAILMQMLLNGGTYGGTRYLNAETVEQFTTRQSEQSTRGIGWDLKSPTHSWAGALLSNRTFLHTGFTGTSVAADPERNLVIIFLTNRVYPTRSNLKISAVRPQVHDAVLRALKPSQSMNNIEH
jgi:beta-glucosidase-like glycosyl hydrolase/CubicO group peptidase (beta-lactamase class C family)